MSLAQKDNSSSRDQHQHDTTRRQEQRQANPIQLMPDEMHEILTRAI